MAGILKMFIPDSCLPQAGSAELSPVLSNGVNSYFLKTEKMGPISGGSIDRESFDIDLISFPLGS